jgi:pilus assembly protein CpaE
MANILVIDDEKIMLKLLETKLKLAGHAAMTCDSGQEGVKWAETKQPELIITDLMMPDLTGYELCKQVRANPATRTIPIIVFSARFQPIDRQTALDAGATEYLSKTTDLNLLIERIEQILAAGQQPSSPTRVGVILGLFSLRGGVGATSLCVNIAIALALLNKTRVALLELTPHGGHAALMLGMRPAGSITDLLAAATEKLSLQQIKPHLLAHESGVYLLAAPHTYESGSFLNDYRLEHLLKTIQVNFPFVIIDLPHALAPPLLPILQAFNRLGVLLSPDLPSIQSTSVALQGLSQLGIAEEKSALVINQTLAHEALPPDSLSKALKRPILAHIPYDPAMIKAVNSGKPLVINHPKSAAAAAIARLARAMTNGQPGGPG